jgi:hypothetical protein
MIDFKRQQLSVWLYKGKSQVPRFHSLITLTILFLCSFTGYNPGMAASPGTLKLLALLTWVIGGVVLFLKGYALIAEAGGLRPDQALNYLPVFIAAAVGSLKARHLFFPSCRRNLVRIDSLSEPKWWQFFRPAFFVFLLCMILLGAWMSRQASGNYSMLLAVSSVDLTLSVALLGSLVGFRGRL